MSYFFWLCSVFPRLIIVQDYSECSVLDSLCFGSVWFVAARTARLRIVLRKYTGGGL